MATQRAGVRAGVRGGGRGGAGDEGERLDFTSSPKAQPELWLPRVQRLLRDQLGLAGRLGVLSERARLELMEEDHEGFDRTLDERDLVLREMGGLAEELRAPMASFASLVASLTDEQARQVRGLVAELNGVLDGVSESDGVVRAELERRRGELGRELALEAERWGRARAAGRVYGEGAGRPSAQVQDGEA
jgi:hypothetical protein